MFTLLKSKSEKHDRGDVIINSEHVKEIFLFKVNENHFMLGVVSNIVVDDTFDKNGASFDTEQDAREALCNMLVDFGVPVGSAQNMAMSFKVHEESDCNHEHEIKDEILGMLAKLTIRKKQLDD